MNDPRQPKIGLLPLLLELYREFNPELEAKQAPFIEKIAGSLGAVSNVVTAPVCSQRDAVRSALQEFERDDVDMVVILFIAYATSLSVLGPLLETNLPILLFSTAPKSSMAEGITTEDITLNHGVHGYMDLANVLRRNRRQYIFVSGPNDDEGAYREIGQWALAAQVRKRLKSSTIGLAGYTFDGMGDFGVDTTMLNATLGPVVKHIPLNLLADAIGDVDSATLDKENSSDRKRFEVADDVDDVILGESNRVHLGLSKVLSDLSIDAFTMHFQGILENPHIRTLPFLAISKLQEQGMAYAGEGDILGATANLMVRLMCGDTIFTETFCPDFDGGRIVMGHMGESNPAFGVKTVLRRKNFAFGDALDPVVTDVHMPPDERATVVNLGIVEDNEFQLIAYTGTLCGRIPGSDEIDMPYFHFTPDMPLADFLTAYGEAGGTHHIALTRGDKIDDIIKLAELLNIDLVILG